MFVNKILVVLVLSICFILTWSRSVSSTKKKDQTQLDKEVLLDDDDYEDDDVLNLTPEEQKDRLKSLVEKKIDVNHDGFVDSDELQAWSLKAFDSFEVDDIREEFNTDDSNKDGFISWEEFTEEMYGKDFSLNDADKKTQQQYRKEKKLYSALATDSEGLNFKDYLAFRIPRSHEKTKEIVIADALENFDLDKDGAINVEEFLKESDHDNDDHDSVESETERFQEEFDTDDDGLLRGDEILQWIDPDNKEDAHDEADHLMSECDANKDHKLSVDEILGNHNLWVESDATDYGKHLLLDHDEF